MPDNHERETIRRGLAVLVDDAPLPPEFDELTTTRVRPVESTKATPFAVVGFAAAMLGIFVVGVVWIGQGAEPSDLAADPSTAAVTAATLADLAPGVFPNVLLSAPNWSVTYIDYDEGTSAEVNEDYAVSTILWSDGSAEAELRMNSGWHTDFEALVADRLGSGHRLADEPIWGTTATMVAQDDTSSYVAIWVSNAVEYEFLIHGTDEATFRALLSSLVQVPEEEWIATLPDDGRIVTDRSEAISAYLEDVPLPPGFEAGSLAEGPIEHWYQVAAETIAAVTCSWVEQWVDTKESGDTQAEQTAVDAMATSHDWKVLNDMRSEGDFPEVIWEYADAMSGDGTILVGDGEFAELNTSNIALGCTD